MGLSSDEVELILSMIMISLEDGFYDEPEPNRELRELETKMLKDRLNFKEKLKCKS